MRAARAPRIGRRAVLAVAALSVCAGVAAIPVQGVIARAGILPGGSALDRGVTVHFGAAVDPGIPWEFRPEHPEMTLRLGETGLAFFSARNTGAHVVAGAADYAVTPAAADRYLVRIECLCRGRQVLRPRESLDLPMSFYIDPRIAEDPATRDIRDITLTYRFHPATNPEEEASITPRSNDKVTN